MNMIFERVRHITVWIGEGTQAAFDHLTMRTMRRIPIATISTKITPHAHLEVLF